MERNNLSVDDNIYIYIYIYNVVGNGWYAIKPNQTKPMKGDTDENKLIIQIEIIKFQWYKLSQIC